MVSLPKVIGVVFCGLLLSLGLSTVVQAEMFDQGQGGHQPDEMQMRQMESGQSAAGKIIEGEVVRVEGNDCVIKSQDGKEVRLQIDLTTLKARHIEPGDRIEVTVNDQNHALTFRPDGQGSPK